jgi:hypothetical protein
MKPPSPIRIDGDTAYIFLKKGFEAMIDVADIQLVRHRIWRLSINKKCNTYYAASGQSVSGDFVTLHRFLLQPPRSLHVDHKDGNGLNNRRTNIRLATGTQNNANMAVSRRNKLGIKGVEARGSLYRATVCTKGKMIRLGLFQTPEEASAAYYSAAKMLWGEYAKK